MEELKFKGLVINESDRRFTKDFDGNVFTIEIPLPFQKAHIISSTCRAAGGYGADVLGEKDYEYIRMLVTLNSVIVEHPDWWNGSDNCPDDNFVIQLWGWYLECEKNFAARLKSKAKTKVLERSK